MPDTELSFGPDPVMHYQGRPFAGLSYEVMGYGARSELTYVEGCQQGPARDSDASGRLRAEESWYANFRHGLSGTYDESARICRLPRSRGEALWGRHMLARSPSG